MIRDPISTIDAAAILGVTRRHVRHLIQIGELPAERMGRDWFLPRALVQRYQRKPRGPRKRAS